MFQTTNQSYRWINPTSPTYNWGHKSLTNWDEPPSIETYRNHPPEEIGGWSRQHLPVFFAWPRHHQWRQNSWTMRWFRLGARDVPLKLDDLGSLYDELSVKTWQPHQALNMEDALFVGAKLWVTHQCLMAEGDEFTKSWSFSGRHSRINHPWSRIKSPAIGSCRNVEGPFWQSYPEPLLYTNITHGDEKSLTCLETTGDSPKGTHELGEFS